MSHLVSIGQTLAKFIRENKFLLKLALVTALGWSCSFSVIRLGFFGASLRTMLDSDVGAPITETVQVFLLVGAITGGIAGLLAGGMNWFILRRQLYGAGKWVATSSLIFFVRFASISLW